MLDSGKRIDFDVSVSVILSRPNKLRAERKGELIGQIFYCDGKMLALYNPSGKVYTTEPAPETFEEVRNPICWSPINLIESYLD